MFPGEGAHSTHLIGWVRPRVSLDSVEKRTIPASAGSLTPIPPVTILIGLSVPLKHNFITEVNQARVFGGGRRGVDGPGGPRRGDSMDKGDGYRERSPLDDRGRDRDRYRYSLVQCLKWISLSGRKTSSDAGTI